MVYTPTQWYRMGKTLSENTHRVIWSCYRNKEKTGNHPNVIIIKAEYNTFASCPNTYIGFITHALRL